MPPSRRRLAPRRRRADDGEEEGSAVGDVEDDSLSEGSALSVAEEDADAEASDASLDEDQDNTAASQTQVQHVSSKETVVEKPTSSSKESDKSPPVFPPSADQDAMLNGLQASTAVEGVEELHSDDPAVADAEVKSDRGKSPGSQADAPKAPRNETIAQKSRREHQEYLKERDSNPAFVPNRGGFFLHDDRSSAVPTFSGRPHQRGRGRGFEPAFHGPRLPIPEPTENKWAHDLHDKHESVPVVSEKPLVVPSSSQPKPVPTTAAPAAPTGPNRTFSFSTVLGKMHVNVLLPGMSEKKAVSNVVKKNHTLLPQHRPPLRRDKPVRISIPDEHPRYIFPSTERSFIFIPRALRPNQQSYVRGRGRGSFHGSRRTSVFGGSTYTPSVAMSRKSSFGGIARDSMRSPAGSASSRMMMMGLEGPRPIVRLPSAGTMPLPMPMPDMPTAHHLPNQIAQMNGTMAYGFHSTAIPMHQPRPQKAVSVADIETPASLSVKAPQQQQEQPFHQQMALYPGSGQAGNSTGTGGTPLSHIPESAIYAQTFQPFPYMQPQMVYGPPYGNLAAFYPPMSNGLPFVPPMPGMSMAPGFASPVMHHSVQPHSQMNQAQQPGTMAHESNGMVYYYDPSQLSGGSQGDQYGMVHLPTMMNPQAPYYYPNGPNGGYYPAHPA